MKKQVSVIILALATLVVVSGCGLKKVNEQKPEVLNNQIQVQNQEQPSQAATLTGLENIATSSETIDTSDWKTYRNKEYGFELKYPNNWIFSMNRRVNKNDFAVLSSPETEKNIAKAKSNNIIELPSGDIVIAIYSQENGEIQSFLKKQFEIIEYKKTMEYKYPGYEIISGGFSKNYSVVFKNKQNILVIFFDLKSSKEELNGIEKQIISNIVLF